MMATIDVRISDVAKAANNILSSLFEERWELARLVAEKYEAKSKLYKYFVSFENYSKDDVMFAKRYNSNIEVTAKNLLMLCELSEKQYLTVGTKEAIIIYNGLKGKS